MSAADTDADAIEGATLVAIGAALGFLAGTGLMAWALYSPSRPARSARAAMGAADPDETPGRVLDNPQATVEPARAHEVPIAR